MGQEASVPTGELSESSQQQQLDGHPTTEDGPSSSGIAGAGGEQQAVGTTGGGVGHHPQHHRHNNAAALREEEDELLEAQARAPPSIAPPQQQPTGGMMSKRKQLLARLTHRPHHHQGGGGEQAANGGNFFITREGMTTDDVAREELSMEQQSQSQRISGGGAAVGALRRLGGGGKTAASTTAGTPATSSSSSTWIQSMRNLTLGSGGAPPRHAQSYKHQQQQLKDWEKQWDEDEDEEEEEEEEGEGQQLPADDRGRGPMAPPLQPVRPGMDVGHTPASSYPQQAAAAAYQQQAVASRPPPPPPSVQSQQQYAIPQQQQQMYQQQPPFVTEESAAVWEQQQQRKQQQQQNALVQQAYPPTVPVSPRAAAVTPPPPMVVAPPPKPQLEMFLPMLRVLGKGSFGKVVLVQKQVGKDRGQLFAMKILQKNHLVKRRQLERTRTERKVLSVVNHPFIMKLHYAFQSADKLYLVLDYCPGGELFFHLSRFRRFPERVARFYAAELLLAMGHLHKRGIIYRDLKPENVLLDADGHVKLGDFGLAKSGIHHPCEGANSMCGTPEYMAPEVLLQAGHGFCVDYWGLGMLVYEMMTGLPPWYTTDRAKLFRRLKSAPLDIPSYFTVQAANCVSALLERDPKRRLGVTGIRTAMEHDFFRTISWRALYARRVEAPVRPCEGWKPPEAVPENDDDMDIMPHHRSINDWNEIDKLNSHELDAATANFDNAFTRLPVESEGDSQNGGHQDSMPVEEGGEELTADTFVGFTFDGKEGSSSSSGGTEPTTPTASPTRIRTHRVNN